MAVKISAHSEQAEGFEKKEDYGRAARAWEKVDHFDRAFENWKKVGKLEGAHERARKKAENYEGEKRWTKAAAIWSQLGENLRAGENWEKGHNWLRAIDSWKKLGDRARLAGAVEKARQRAKKYEVDKSWFWAAKYWENLGEWVQAALAWEKDRKYDEAAVCWERSGRWINASIDWEKIGDARAEKNRERAKNDASRFEREKLFLKAAKIRKALGEYERAAEDFENARAWMDASNAWKIAGKEERMQKAEEMAEEQLKIRNVPLLEGKWGDFGDLERAARSWSKSEWRGMAEKFESEGNIQEAAHCYCEGDEWKKAAILWEKSGYLAEARDCWQRVGDIERANALEKKIHDEALLEEKEGEFRKAGKSWEALNEWVRAAEMWKAAGEPELEKEAVKNSAIKHEIYGKWYEAALERKEIGDYSKAIADLEKSSVAKTPEEREFYKDIIIGADAFGALRENKRLDWVAYSYLVKGAMGDSSSLRKIMAMEPEGEPYVLHWLCQCYKLAAHWGGSLDTCIEFLRGAVEVFGNSLSKVLLRETKILCLEYIIAEHSSLFVIGERLGDNELMRESMESLRLYVSAYMKISSSKNLTDGFLRRLVAFNFLEGDWKGAKKLCDLGARKFGKDFYRLSRDVAGSLESAKNIDAAFLLYSYSFKVPKDEVSTKDAFLKGMWIPDTFLNSPEYIISLVAEEKAELQEELKEKYRELLERADMKFGQNDYGGASALYEEFLEFPLTVGLEARVLKNLVKCASELKRGKDKRRFAEELERLE